MRINAAIQQHGAVAVHSAAYKALQGDYAPLARLGVKCSTLSEAYASMSAAYKQMDEAERAIDNAQIKSLLSDHDQIGGNDDA